MVHVYIDESGDLGKNGSCYFIISALIVNEPRLLDNIIKRMRRHKFKKELKKAEEIKANKSSKILIKYVLTELNRVGNAHVITAYLKKKDLHSQYLLVNRNKLYNFVAGKIAKNLTIQDNNIEIRVDKSKGKEALREDFDNYFLKALKKGTRINKIKVSHSYSHSFAGIQLVDILAWSYFQKFEHNNPEFINLITLKKETVAVCSKSSST